MRRFLNETAAFLATAALMGWFYLTGQHQEAGRVWAEFTGLLDEGIEAERSAKE